MTEIPSAVLSQHLRKQLSGRRVTAAVFMTYNLEPAFFEEEVVALLAGDELISEPRIRLLQLEQSLRNEIGPIAVYYDPSGLRPDGAKRLDIRYVPVRVGTGLFHPKVVLLLTESTDPADSAASSLILGVLSANLTKSGWWSSLECAHIEIVNNNELCSYREDLMRLLLDVRKLGGREADGPRTGDHEALDKIHGWLRRESATTRQATSGGALKTRLVAGTRSLPDFLEEVRGDHLSGCSLEVISPFFDAQRPSALEALVTRFGIKECRVFLPSADDGSALVSNELYEAVRDLPDCAWSRLPQPLLKLGKEKGAKLRGVHAKVYRFLKKSTGYEAIVVGSHNLTTAAHQRGGNFEASFVIERDGLGRLDWWLEVDEKRPRRFVQPSDDPEETQEQLLPLEISFNWASGVAEVLWSGRTDSPRLRVESAGAPVFEVAGLPRDTWVSLAAGDAEALRTILVSTSILRARRDDEMQSTVLVQEYGMAQKPSMLLTLSVSDVLEFWSRLTSEQRAAFLADRAGSIPEGFIAELERSAQIGEVDSFFTSYAGIFHGFEMLRKQVTESLDQGHERQTDHLVFGKRPDSLPNLIERVLTGGDEPDAIKRYLILLSARHLLMDLRRSRDPFLLGRRVEINKMIRRTSDTRLLTESLDLGEDGQQFIEWFERHFLRSLARETEDAVA